VVLNGRNESLYLMWPGGGFSDEVTWRDAPDDGLAVARAGGRWGVRQPATPGQPNEPGLPASALPPNALPAVAAPAASPYDGGAQLAGAAPNGADAPAPLALRNTESGALPSSAPQAPAAAAGGALAGLRTVAPGATVTIEGRVALPPGLMHGAFYLVDAAGNGVRVYLPLQEFAALAPGDRVRVHGTLANYRGEREVVVAAPAAVEWLGASPPPQPEPTTPSAIGEPMEGRLVTLHGAVVRVDGDSLYLADLRAPAAAPLRVVVLRSLGWPCPAAQPGELWRATGVVSQLEGRTPGGGYRLLVRFPSDLERILVE
jgi:hypothetical protein